MELTTDNLIKIVLGVFVIVALVLGIYFAMNSYVIPYFSGIGFEEPKIDINTDFGKELIQDKNLIGTVDKDGYFTYKNENVEIKTDIYFKDGKIYLKEYLGSYNKDSWTVTNWIKDHLNADQKIGSLDSQGKIIINKEVQYGEILNNAYKNGNEIYKIK